MVYLWAMEINVKRTFWSSIRWGVTCLHSKQTIKNTETFYNRAHRPRWATVHTTDRKRTSDPTREGEFNVMYKIHRHLSTRLEEKKKKMKKRQKKTIQTICASCYTERHSVWYVGDYCRRILTHNCYKVERKGSTLSSNGNSCMFDVLEKACANVLEGGVKPPKKLSLLSKMGNNWSSFSIKTQTRPPCIRRRTADTRGKYSVS